MLFRSRGNLVNDPRYGTQSRVITIDEMLSYRNTWREKLSPDFDVQALLKDARTVKTSAVVLPVSDKGYKVKDTTEIDEGERVVRAVQSVLNKLTEKNYDELIEQVHQLQMKERKVVEEVVAKIYEKALDEPAFSHLYAQLCSDVSLRANRQEGQSYMIDAELLRMSIIQKAQDTFEEMSHLTSTDESEVDRIRKRKLANMKFVGALFIRKMLKCKVMNSILTEIFKPEMVNPPPPSAIDAEVALELLNVVGKQLEAMTSLRRIWEVISMHVNNGALGKRLTFLYQNLVDWQASGWAKRDEPGPLTSPDSPAPVTPATPAAPSASSSSAVGPFHGKKGHDAHPSDKQSSSSATPNILSRNTSTTLACSNSQADMTSSSSGVPTLTAAEKKNAALARPPEAFTEDHARNVCGSIRDTLVDKNWEKTKAEFSTIIPTEQEKSNRMACFYGLMTQICWTAKESERRVLIQGLTHPQWDSTEVCRGVAWALTESIANSVREDCPLFHDRFASVVAGDLANTHVPVIIAVKDVFARSANYLDALFIPLEGTPDWDVDFVNVWELYIQACMNSNRTLPPIAEVLDSLGSVRQTAFMRNILPDFVQAMISTNLCTKDELDAWRTKQENNAKVAELVTELSMIL